MLLNNQLPFPENAEQLPSNIAMRLAAGMAAQSVNAQAAQNAEQQAQAQQQQMMAQQMQQMQMMQVLRDFLRNVTLFTQK